MAKKIIDGNQIINDNLAEQARYGGKGYGIATDAATGRVLAEVNGQPGVAQPPSQSAFAKPTLEQVGLVPTQEQADAAELTDIRAEEQYLGGGGSYGPDSSPSDPYDDPEFLGRQEEYLNDAGNFSNYMEKIGQTSDDVWNGMGGDFTDKDMSMFMDARNAKTEEDQIRLGEINDRWMDMNDIDAMKYYQEGVLEECDADCQERRQMEKAQVRDYDESVLAEGDQSFLSQYQEPV